MIYEVTNVWIKFNSEGYVSYYKLENKGFSYDMEIIDSTDVRKFNKLYEYRFSDFGNITDAVVPAAAIKAVENYKAANPN